MEHYKEYVGCDLCKTPLSNIAQRIMSAMQSLPLEETHNNRKSEPSKYLKKKNACSTLTAFHMIDKCF